MKKKIISMMLSLLLLVAMAVPAFAANPDDTVVDPQYNTVCGNYTYHDMYGCGWGDLWVDHNGDGTVDEEYIDDGCMWQCVRCDTMMVTEGDNYLGEMEVIGKWGTRSPDEYQYPWFVSVLYTGPGHYGVCNTNTMTGYRFNIWTRST